MTSRRWASSASANCLRVMVLRSAVTSTRPGSTSMTGRFLSAKDLRSGTGFQPGSKSRWQRTSRVVHCPGASLFSRCASMPWSCALSCAQALFVRPRRSLTFAHAMARTSHQLDSTLLAEEPAPLHLRRVREAEGLHDGVAHVVGGRIRRVGHQEVVQVRGLERALLEQRAAKKIEERLPELGAHQHDGEVADLAGLDERRGLADLIERPEPAGQGDEGVGVLHEHDLADVEVAERHPPVEVRVRLLLLRQLDVAADGPPARLPGAAVGALHDARAAARHHREAVARQARADLPRHLVVPVLVRHAGRAKHGDAGPDEMQRAEAADELGEDAQRAKELDEPRLGTRQEAVLFGIRAAFAPAPAARRAQLHLGSHGISPSAPTPSGMAAGPHGAQRLRVSGGNRMTLGVPMLAARWLTPESLPMYAWASASAPTASASAGPWCTTTSKPPSPRMRSNASAKRAAGARFQRAPAPGCAMRSGRASSTPSAMSAVRAAMRQRSVVGSGWSRAGCVTPHGASVSTRCSQTASGDSSSGTGGATITSGASAPSRPA